MITEEIFTQKVQELKNGAGSLTENSDEKSIETVANALKAMKYSPTLLFDTPQFVTFTKQDLLDEINRVAGLTKDDKLLKTLDKSVDPNEIKLTHITLLINHFKLLTRLRDDEDEAWEEVNELYEDD